ncbi:MAG: YggS family pyridoxal phosphate-dependent enzyme [Candidatus Diapherotrites archaeon]|nr:YggS family pyridoxal phosphate-dependent enzyme [Candidatus Diapherotrites archaeon]
MSMMLQNTRPAKNLGNARQKIAEACRRAGRNESEITLLPVSKGRSISQIESLISLGFNAFGENYANELLEKRELLAAHKFFPEWHFIGHLQSNKAAKIVPIASMIQSVDSEKLAGKISNAAASTGKTQNILVEVNIGGEMQKFGVPPGETVELCKKILVLPNVRLCGLMCMAPLAEPEQAGQHFKKMFSLFERAKKELGAGSFIVLSMGMTNDFEAAIEEGSTMVRIGRALFE